MQRRHPVAAAPTYISNELHSPISYWNMEYNSISLLRMPAPFLVAQQDPALGEGSLKCENISEMFGKS